MQLDLGLASGVLPRETVRLHQLHSILLGHADVEDALVVPA